MAENFFQRIGQKLGIGVGGEPLEPEAQAEIQKHERHEAFRQWKHRIEKAKKSRKDWEDEYKVKDLENYYLGKQGQNTITVFNYFAATVKAEQPELFFTQPTFLVRPKPIKGGPANDRIIARSEALLKSIATQDDNLEISGELATVQSFFRIGVLKSIYDPNLEPNPRAGQPIFMHGDDGAPAIGPDGQPMPLMDPRTGQPLTEPDQVLNDETYRWEWVDAKRMLLPDDGPDQRKWSWIGEEISVKLAEAQADIRFPEDLRLQLRSNESSDPDNPEKPRSAKDFDGKDEDDEMFRYCECYDIRRKRWYIYAEGQTFDKFLVDDVLPDGIEDHPYAVLAFDPILGPKPSAWPKPPVFDWKPIQSEYNIRRNQITEGAKRTARKVFYDEGTFPDEIESLKALQSSKDMEAVKVNTIQKIPQSIADANQSPDLYKDVQLLQMDYRLISGQTGANLGIADSNTATEASFAQRASNARTADKRKVITRWMRQSGRKMLQLVQGTMTLKQWVSIRGLDDKQVAIYAQQVYGLDPVMLGSMPGIKQMLIDRLGEQKWTQTTREEMTFEADVDVVPGSVRARTLDLERQEWLEFLKVIGMAPQLLMSRELLTETATKYETITQKMIDELLALAPKMMAAQQTTAGHAGDNAQGGGAGPSPIENALTAMSGSVQ